MAGPADAAAGAAAASAAVRAGGGVPAARARPGAHRDAARHRVVAGRLEVRGEGGQGAQGGQALPPAQLHGGAGRAWSHHGLAAVDLQHPARLAQLGWEAVGNVGQSASLVTSNSGILAA